jgi:hypothetical protein
MYWLAAWLIREDSWASGALGFPWDALVAIFSPVLTKDPIAAMYPIELTLAFFVHWFGPIGDFCRHQPVAGDFRPSGESSVEEKTRC